MLGNASESTGKQSRIRERQKNHPKEGAREHVEKQSKRKQSMTRECEENQRKPKEIQKTLRKASYVGWGSLRSPPGAKTPSQTSQMPSPKPPKTTPKCPKTFPHLPKSVPRSSQTLPKTNPKPSSHQLRFLDRLIPLFPLPWVPQNLPKPSQNERKLVEAATKISPKTLS